jgi:hypothetical protein
VLVRALPWLLDLEITFSSLCVVAVNRLTIFTQEVAVFRSTMRRSAMLMLNNGCESKRELANKRNSDYT